MLHQAFNLLNPISYVCSYGPQSVGVIGSGLDGGIAISSDIVEQGLYSMICGGTLTRRNVQVQSRREGLNEAPALPMPGANNVNHH